MWKDIPGYEGQYQIDENGTVKSLSRKIRFGKNSYRITEDKILKPMTDRYGYLRVDICGRHRLIHQMVAETFIGKPIEKVCVNHIDGNKQNNNIENLEYCSWSRNNQHAYDSGLKPKGSDSGVARLTESQVIEIKTRGHYASYKTIAKDYGVCSSTISDIFNEKTWAYIPWPQGA